MELSSDIHHRRSIRLKGYDYSLAGAYFVTVVTKDRRNLFGNISGGEMIQNNYGIIVENTWKAIPQRYKYVESDTFIVMPNHFHAILMINDLSRGGLQPAPTEKIKIKPLGELIGAFKTISAKQINLMRNSPGMSIWQRNYYEHIIRNEKEWEQIREYILENPRKWGEDEENPIHWEVGLM